MPDTKAPQIGDIVTCDGRPCRVLRVYPRLTPYKEDSGQTTKVVGYNMTLKEIPPVTFSRKGWKVIYEY